MYNVWGEEEKRKLRRGDNSDCCSHTHKSAIWNGYTYGTLFSRDNNCGRMTRCDMI